MELLRGNIYITDSLDVIYNASTDGSIKIISLDEDNILPESKDILGGTCLLPPLEAKIAEADGNEPLYDRCYINHLMAPYQQQFISAIISFLYKGGNLILFLPEIGYNNTMNKFIQHFFTLFGIHIGIIGEQDPRKANCYSDTRCIPIWLNMIYSARVISVFEYLYMYPVDALIDNQEVLMQIITELRPYGQSINEKINYIKHFHKAIHKNPKVIPAIYMEV